MILSQLILLLLIVLVLILYGTLWTIKSTYPEKLPCINDTNIHAIFGVIELVLVSIYIYIAYIRGKQTDEEENNGGKTDMNEQSTTHHPFTNNSDEPENDGYANEEFTIEERPSFKTKIGNTTNKFKKYFTPITYSRK